MYRGRYYRPYGSLQETTVWPVEISTNTGHEGPRYEVKRERSPVVQQSGTVITRGRTRPNVPLSSKFRTEMCHYLAELDNCPFGESCTYAHSRSELRYIKRHPKHKTQTCRDFTSVGFCPFGERCSFIHEKPDTQKLFEELMASHDRQSSGSLRPPTASSGFISPSLSRSSSASDLSQDSALAPPQIQLHQENAEAQHWSVTLGEADGTTSLQKPMGQPPFRRDSQFLRLLLNLLNPKRFSSSTTSHGSRHYTPVDCGMCFTPIKYEGSATA